MNEHTNVQIITQGGQPAFAVLPYAEYLALTGQQDADVYIPHEVVKLQIKNGLSLIAAWRKYKKMTQGELAKAAGISQPALSQIEKQDSKPQLATLEKIAAVMGIDTEQLRD